MNDKVILLQIIAIVLVQNFDTINSVIVKTKSGPINGLSVTFDNKTINKFLGVPYAEPPIGINRFGKTKPVHPWNSTYDATHIKNVCFQKSSTYKMSEDCLFLNIFAEQRKSGDTKLHPVMFWIHGGGLNAGDGYIDGTVLASKEVVIVSINYRLGPFGFLYGGDSTAPGNVGILDQIMALHWVKDNIELFGGDPNQITIFGHSAGSWSVSTLIVSPLSKNLFKRAIMESAAYIVKPIINSDKATHLNQSKKLSETLGCSQDSKWLDCLRNKSGENIINQNTVGAALTYGDDAGVVPFGIEQALNESKFNTGIELIAGITDNEWYIGAAQTYPKMQNMSIHITKDELKTTILSAFSSHPGVGQSVYDYYISHVDENNQTLLRRKIAEIISDEIISCPTYYFAKKYSQMSSIEKTYFYVLTYKSKYSPCKEEWMGVCHGDELVFVFGNPIAQRSSFTETDYEFSSMLIQIWTDFAKTGNPLSHSITNKSGKEVKNWPEFIDKKLSSITPKVMELNPMNFGNVLVDPYHGNCDVVMKPLFD